MSAPIWNVPGPAAFVQSLARDVADGRHLLARLPDWLANHGLSRELKERLLRQDEIHLHVAPLRELEDEAGPPEEALLSRFGFKRPAGELAGFAAICAAAGGHAFWLTGLEALTPIRQARWLDWLQEFAEQTKDLDPADYPVIGLVAKGGLQATVPPADLKFGQYLWWNQLSRAEVQLLASGAAEAGPRSLQAAMAIELAGPDLALAEAFMRINLLDDGEIGSLLEALVADRGLADCRGLAVEAIERSPIRRPGQESDEELTPHTARELELVGMGLLEAFRGEALRPSTLALALGGDPLAVRRRVWYAQLAVLLPEIDDFRRRIIEYLNKRFTRKWTLWFPTEAFQKMEPEQIEIGNLNFLFNSYRSVHLKDVDPAFGETIRWLCDMRNELAHLRPVDSTALARGRESLEVVAGVFEERRRQVRTLSEAAR